MSKQKRQQTFSKNKSAKLYLYTKPWLLMLKVGGTGIIMSLVLALFIFIDQLMLVNLMPQTTKYDFNNLFLYNNGIFKDLIKSNFENVTYFYNSSSNTRQLILGIGNSTGLGIVNSSSIVRTAVSLSSSVLFIIRSLPGMMSAGASVLYARALGSKNAMQAQEVWRNAFAGAMIGSIIGFCITIILIPTVVPTQAVNAKLSANLLYYAHINISNKLAKLGYIWNVTNNQIPIYYTTLNNQLSFFIQVTNTKNEVLYINLSQNLLYQTNILTTKLNNPNLFSINLTSGNNNVLELWTTYFAYTRKLSITWAENFLYVMDVVAIIQCFVNLLISVLRVDGELKYTTIITVITVCINILLDWVFISKAQIGMEGAATASVIGFLIDFLCLAIFLEKNKHSQNAKFRNLNLFHFKLNKKLIINLFLLGLNNLISGIGMLALFICLTQEMSTVSETLLPANGSEYYLSIFGAIMPFLNLMFATLLGFALNTIQLYSYNYAAYEKQRVIAAYWFGNLYLFVIALIAFLLLGICNPIKAGVLSWFDITKNSGDNELASAQKMMLLWMTQILSFSIMSQSTVVFLAGGRIKTALFVALLRTVLIPIPVLYIYAYLAIKHTIWFNGSLSVEQLNNPSQNNAMWFFIASIPSYTALYAIILFTMASIYVHFFMFKPLQKKANLIQKIEIY